MKLAATRTPAHWRATPATMTALTVRATAARRTPARPGAMAKYRGMTLLPAASLHPLNGLRRALGDEARVYGCLAEPLGVVAKALHEALRTLPRRAGRSLLVHGGGPLGVCAGVVGRALGFDPVVLVEPLP